MKLAILGGGGVRMPAFVRAVLTVRPTAFDEIHLAEPDAVRRDTICRLAAEVAVALGRPGVVRVTADAAEAFTGADYVFSAIRVGGDRGRVIDEEAALRRGIVGQETTGAGGCAMALRTIPVVLSYCDLLSRCSPGAVLVNFTNPAGLITQAISAQGKVPVAGVCDTPGDTIERLAAFLGAGECAVSGSYGGLNHLGWVCSLRSGGRDHIGELLARFEDLQRFDDRFAAFDPGLVRRVGAIPTEYVYYYYDSRRYLSEVARAGSTRGADVLRLNTELIAGLAKAFGRGDVAAAWSLYDALLGVRGDTYLRTDMFGDSGQDRARARRAVPAPASGDAGERQAGRAGTDGQAVQRDAAGRQPGAALTGQAGLGGYEALALRVIDGLAGRGPADVVVNMAAGARLGLDPGDVVEIPARVDAGGLSPLAVPRLPRSAHGLVAQVKEYERGVIEAAATRDAGLAAVALSQHPLVPGITAARELITEYRELHRRDLAYLR